MISELKKSHIRFIKIEDLNFLTPWGTLENCLSGPVHLDDRAKLRNNRVDFDGLLQSDSGVCPILFYHLISEFP